MLKHTLALRWFALVIGAMVVLLADRANADETIELLLQRRVQDAPDGPWHIEVTGERVDPKTVGIIVVDMWNFHWCKTSSARVGSLVPRMEKTLLGARELGMQVFYCPTDAIEAYVGTAPRERALAAPRLELPRAVQIQCPPARDGGGCTCHTPRCQVNFGWDAMHPGLSIDENDLMPNDPRTIYAFCKERGIKHLIYMGVHTQVCLLGKSIGVRAMLEAGMSCSLARDLTDAHGLYDPEAGITPDQFTADVIEHFEKHLVPTINMVDTMRAAGKWDDAWLVDPVRMAPWGTLERPHHFDDAVTLTVTAPWQKDATIHYTLDGSDPTPGLSNTLRYTEPLVLKESTLIRAQAFDASGKPAGLLTQGYYAKRGPEPPLPNVYISDLTPRRAVGPGHSESSTIHRFSPHAQPPQMDKTNKGGPLILRGQKYEKGVGVHAPNQLIYAIEPRYKRFVAQAGVDETILQGALGSNLAMHPSVIFRVFIDGELAAESPVMRISEPPWRFDVAIPEGSHTISLSATDAGNGSNQDFANWVNAGFVTK